MSHAPADRPNDLRRATSPSHSARSRPQSTVRPLGRYKVVLHHNPQLDLMFVVRTVMELTRFCRDEATHKMWQAHHTGQSVLLVTYLERAELYVEQFANRGLTVSIAQA